MTIALVWLLELIWVLGSHTMVNYAYGITIYMPSSSGRNIAKIKLSLVTASAETTKFEFSQPGGTNGQAAE